MHRQPDRRPATGALLGFLLAGAALAGASFAQPGPGDAALVVDLATPGPAISPQLWGIFFEEINHAGDGGLYAELVRNRSLEDAASPEGWSLTCDGGGEGALALDVAQPLNEQTPHSLRLQVRGTQGRVGAANAGFWGIALQRGRRYRYAFYARRDDAPVGPISVSLEGAAGRVYARREVSGVAPEWKRFEGVLVSSSTDPAARLVLSGRRPGTLWFDVVSLIPAETWKGRPNGMRADLARLIDDLRPAFIRFPGGCYCEGDRLANAFRWKRALGDIAGRPGHWNLWGYRSSDGLGLHEYLQLCEDLRATPLFVVNCGMAHNDMAPLDRLDEWVHDALDALEYANGPPASKWGALRSANGHPAPFGLTYLEIGNENGWGASLPRYEERWARFYDAIKSRYPEVRLVANVPVKSRPPDLIDDHYYHDPEWFLANAGRYDGADRGGPRIYVGEYAVTQKCGQGNLRAALAEAAFMTGLERNSDLVTMASYAPLFVNVRDRRWNPDTIVFDNRSCYGTPSYYVQQLFSLHRCGRILPTRLTAPAPDPVVVPGGIGLGTWRTRAEFRDVQVTRGERVLFRADSAAGNSGWQPVRGDWKLQDGAYRQDSLAEDLRTMAGDRGWTDYTLRLQARKLAGAEGFLVMFRARDDGNWYWWNLGGWNNQRHAVEKSAGGSKSILPGEVAGRIETDRWYDIRVELSGPRIRCYLDGRLVHDIEDRGPPTLFAVAGLTSSGEIVLKVVNPTGAARDTEIRLEGGRRIASQGMAVVLTGNGPDEENSLSQPDRVAPVTLPLAGAGAAFRHTFPPYSLTVVRLRERR